MRAPASLTRATILLALTAAPGCGPPASVVRVVHGRTLEGVEVSERAYASYAQGAYLEARGDLQGAASAFSEALDHDAKSPAIWLRLGSLACRGQRSRAMQAFEQAIKLDQHYAPAWAERARCEHWHAELPSALASAERAIALDPSNTAANLLVARIYQETGRLEAAQSWLLALALREPGTLANWRALWFFARECADAALAHYARGELSRRSRPSAFVSELRERPPRSEPASGSAADTLSDELLSAFRAGNLALARAVATQESVSPAALGVLAALRGYPELAAAQAELLLDANPKDTDAFIAALAAAQFGLAPGRAEQLMRLTQAQDPPSPLAARLLSAMIRWQIGEEAAQSWDRAYERQAAAAAR